MVKLLPHAGYPPQQALTSYVVYATPNGVPTPIHGDVYAVGAGDQGGLHSAWVAA